MEYFIKFIELLGLPKEVGDKYIFYIIILAFLIPIIRYLWKFLKWIVLKKNQRLLNKDLEPYFLPSDVTRATKYYIPTRYQNVSPSEDDEPGRKYIASAKEKLIPLFLKKVFTHEEDCKYYLILADSGMGKTTLLINLYLKYINKINSPFSKPKFGIKLFPLGAPVVLNEIDKIENKNNTILLLDAFDEDISAIQDHSKRLNEILNKVQNFKKIIITCRTQFFCTESEEPYKAGYITYGEGGEYLFQKLYLSVFDDDDVKKYIKKRFSFFRRNKRKKAKQIAKKSPNLVVRPMLLSYINDLVESKKTFEYTYQIYEVLIKKWIERESKKPGIKNKFDSENNYKKLLYNDSQELAYDFYKNRTIRGGYFIEKNEIINVGKVFKLENFDEDSKTLTEAEKRSKSLLNRNAIGQYKFSHKSILEYFLAEKLFNDVNFFKEFNFEGMDVAKRFYDEMLIEKLKIIQGFYWTYNLKRDLEKHSLSELTIADYQNIKRIQINELGVIDIKFFRHLSFINELILFDKEKYNILYNLYSIYYFSCSYIICLRMLPKKDELIKIRDVLDSSELIKRLERLDFKKLIEIQELIERLKMIEQYNFTELIEFRNKLELMTKNLTNKLENGEREKFQEQQEIHKLIDRRSNKEPFNIELKNIKNFLRDMKELQANLPNCKMYY